MLRGSKLGSSVGTLQDLARVVHGLAVETHRRFDRDVWRTRAETSVETRHGKRSPAYHDEIHVEAVVACVRAVFAAVRGGVDPFDLERDLGLWNSRAAKAVDWEALGSSLEIAFSCHDLGNITRSAELRDGPAGGIVPDLGLTYDSSALYPEPAVETRSAEIASGLLARLLPDEDRRAGLDTLIRHLVLSTVFHFDKRSSPEPFWLVMQTVDMVGSYFFSGQRRWVSVAGLFNEMRIQRPGTVQLLPFLASLEQRFELLLPEPGRRAAAMSIFERNSHGFHADTVFPVPDQLSGDSSPIPYEEAIRLLLDFSQERRAASVAIELPGG